MQRTLAIFGLLSVSIAAYGGELPNHRQGYVTKVDGATAFQLDGQPVTCDAKTQIGLIEVGKTIYSPAAENVLLLGEHVEVMGHRVGGKYVAESVLVARPPAKDEAVHGYVRTLVASPLQAASGSWQGAIAADGRQLRVVSKTVIDFADLSPGIVPAGVWLTYDGTRFANGHIVLDKVTLRRDAVTPEEATYNVRIGNRVTPPEDGPHGEGEIKYPIGRVRLIAKESEEQRLQLIGDRLMPEYQKALPPGSPEKLTVRFFVTDRKITSSGLSFADGSIVFSEKSLSEVSNHSDDEELAALIAYHLADLLQKQDFRASARRNRQQKEAAVTLAAAFVPGLGIAGLALNAAAQGAGIYEGIAYTTPEMLIFAQDCRIGMQMMQQAGYDPGAMPLAFIHTVFPAKNMDGIEQTAPVGYKVVMRELRENYGTASVGAVQTSKLDESISEVNR